MIRPTDHRLRFIRIPVYTVLDWFFGAAKTWNKLQFVAQFVALPKIDLPEDATVLCVHHDFLSKCFHFQIHSSTFSEVPEGAEIPEWEGAAVMRSEIVELRTEADREREKMDLIHPRGYPQPGREYVPRPIGMQYGVAGEWLQLGEEVEWSPDLGMTWRKGCVVEIDFPNNRVSVKEGGHWYRVAIRDIRPIQGGVDPAHEGDDKTVINFDSGDITLTHGSIGTKLWPHNFVAGQLGQLFSDPCPQCAAEFGGDVLSCPHPKGDEPSEADAMMKFFKGEA